MKTLQTGTKVLIEATVEQAGLARSYVTFKDKSGIWLRNSDLTVCETAQPLPTPSFKAGQEEIEIGQTYFNPFGQKCRVVVFDGEDKVNHPYVCFNEFNYCYEGWLASQLRPIPAQPTVESELLEIVEGVESCRYSTKLAVEKILAWHQKYTRLSSELRNLLEDVVNELELSDGMIEKHGPLGTEPSKLVRLVLDQKDQQIKALKAGMVDIKHSGRVEVSVPSDDEIEKDGKERGLRDNELQLWWEGAVWMRNFMTRKEAK